MHRAKTIKNGEWVKGTHIDSIPPFSYIITNEQMRKIKTPLYPAGGYVEPITTNATQVMGHTAGRSTEFFDKNDIEIFEGDIVRFFGMTGVVVCEAGAFGVSCEKAINYDVLENNIPTANNPAFCYNDNFISLWELIWNFSDLDGMNVCDVVEVIGNKFDNPDLL